MARKKANLMSSVTDLAVGGVGGFVGLQASTIGENLMLKVAPKFVVAAPAIVAIAAEMASNAVKDGSMWQKALKGAALVTITETFVDVFNMVAKPKGSTSTTDTAETTTDTDAVNGLRAPVSSTNPIRLNGGYLMFN